jgi:hypothetical protein
LREEFLENSMHTCRNTGAEYTRQQSRATCARHPVLVVYFLVLL